MFMLNENVRQPLVKNALQNFLCAIIFEIHSMKKIPSYIFQNTGSIALAS